MLRTMSCLALLVALTACSKPQPPEKERPPEPQAHTELRDAIQAPIEKAEKVEEDVLKAADEQRAVIEAQGG